MKVLLDSCVWGGALSALQSAGHEVEWAGGWAEDPGDHEILDRAHAAGQVLVTLDKDFGELAIVHARPHCGIVRLVNLSARMQGPTCAAVLQRYSAELRARAIITVEATRVRIRVDEDG